MPATDSLVGLGVLWFSFVEEGPAVRAGFWAGRLFLCCSKRVVSLRPGFAVSREKAVVGLTEEPGCARYFCLAASRRLFLALGFEWMSLSGVSSVSNWELVELFGTS